MNEDFEKMSVQQLTELKEKIGKVLQKKVRAQKSEALKKVKELMKEFELNGEDMAGILVKGKRGRKSKTEDGSKGGPPQQA